MKRPTKQ